MKTIFKTLFICGVLGTGVRIAQAGDSFPDSAPYGRVLARFVKDGRVDYKGLKADSRDLDVYLESVSRLSPEVFARHSTNERLALLLNSYNAHTLKLIVDHYPLKSIRDLGNPWDRPVVAYLGRSLSLNALEHDVVRKEYNDPRVHFALVCAARGCPPLRSEPYLADRLNAQLEDQTRRFLSDRERNGLDEKGLFLSPIFDWYKKDFVEKSGSVASFVAGYFPPEVAQKIRLRKLPLRYTPYDWALNERGE